MIFAQVTELQGWSALIGTFGLAVVLVLWYVFIRLPKMDIREDADRAANRASVEKIVDTKEKSCAAESQKDREHSLKLAETAGEVHKYVATEIKVGLDLVKENVTAIGRKADNNGERIAKLEDAQRAMLSAVQKIIDRDDGH